MGNKAEKSNKQFVLLHKALEVFAVVLIFVMVNSNALIFFPQFADIGYSHFNEWENVYIIVIATLLVLIIMWKDDLFKHFTTVWSGHWLLLLFLMYASTSLVWTVYLPGSLYKLLLLFFSTFAGAYLAVKYKLHGIIAVLSWIAGICSIMGIIFVMFVPYGIMRNEPFVGSWVGIFWHRNHTGNLFAFFSAFFLLRLLGEVGLHQRKRITFLVFFLLSTIMVFGSRSATGIIIYLFLNFTVILIAIWLRLHSRLKPHHYIVTASLLLLGFLVFVTNTSFFFGLVGRSPDMTGRLPLWQDLYSNYFLKEAVFGYGFGALWMQESFRNLMQFRHGWKYPVYFADNGFFDIMLNMGVIGLLLFFGIYIKLGIRSIFQGIKSKLWFHFFPFLIFLYIFTGNLTYSFLLEVDQFVWMLMIIGVFVIQDVKREHASA